MQLTLSVKGRTLADDTSVKEVSIKHADKGYDYPLGLVGFSYTTENTSDEVSLVFVTDLKPNQVVVRKYNPTDDSYKTIDDAKVTRTKVDGNAALKVTYTIEDNGPLDLNPAVGEVTDPVGLAVSTIGVPNTGTAAQSALPVVVVGLAALATVATAAATKSLKRSDQNTPRLLSMPHIAVQLRDILIIMKKSSTFYDDVIKGGYDVRSGVYAAHNPDLTMSLDEYGEYRYAEIEALKDPALAKLSAMSDESPNEDAIAEKLFADQPDIKRDPVLGYYLDLYAGHVAQGDYRKNGSSGGLGTWITVQLLENNLVDAIIHVKEVNDDGVLFKYCISETVDEVRQRSKSRYYPVELSDVLSSIKLDDKRYAIVGITGFIAEIQLLRLSSELFREKIKYTIGLVTGHQKSAKYAEALAWEQGVPPGSLLSIDFRKLIEGNGSNDHATESTFLENGHVSKRVANSGSFYVSDWGHGFFKTKFSDYNDDPFNETADITLGDAWLPEYISDGEGSNIVIVRNHALRSIINDGLKRKALKLDRLTPQRVRSSQSGLIHHTRDELPYRLHKLDASGQWFPKKRFLPSNEIPTLRKIAQSIRIKISTKSRLVYQDAVSVNDISLLKKKTRNLVRLYRVVYAIQRSKSYGIGWAARKVVNKLTRR